MTSSSSTTSNAPLWGFLGLSVLTILFFWLFQDILLPFILGAVIAYLLNPLVTSLADKKGMTRRRAVLLIIIGFFGIILAAMATIIPLIIFEVVRFIENLPHILTNLSEDLMPMIEQGLAAIGMDASALSAASLSGEHLKGAAQGGIIAGGTLAEIGLGGINVLTVTVFTVITSYFMMMEGNQITAKARRLIPRPYTDTIERLWKEIDRKLSGFIRGQLTVCLILGIGYAFALSLAGLEYGMAIGLMSGLLSVIPMLGSTLGLLVSLIVAWLQEGTLLYVAIIAAIYLTGQLLEGNLITPKIIGDSVGLHPLWIFFALTAGASVLGILGMLIAVPVAAIVSVLISFAIERYKDSSYYTG